MPRRDGWLGMGEGGGKPGEKALVAERVGDAVCLLPRGSSAYHSYMFKILHFLHWLLDYILSS